MCVSHPVVSDTVTPWIVAHQAPLSMGFFRQEYWSGLPFPPPGDLPKPGIEPESPVASAFYILVDKVFTVSRSSIFYSFAVYSNTFVVLVLK